MPRNHEQLEVFRIADALVEQAYKLTMSFPRAEMFGLQAQIRRAAVSAATNIVEGCARSSPRELARFLEISAGSAAEVRYLMQLVIRLGFLAADRIGDYDDQLTDY